MNVQWFPACLVFEGRRYRADWSVEYGLVWYDGTGVPHYFRDRLPG